MPHAEYSPAQNVIHVQTTWAEKELIKSVPGSRWDVHVECWSVPASWASLVMLRGVFKESLTLGPAVCEWGWNIRQARVDPALEIRTQLEYPVTPGVDEHLYPFQRAGVEFMTRAGSGLLGDDMGTGKSIQTLTLNLARIHRGEVALPALIICPNSVKRHWVREIAKWMPGANAYNVDGTAAVKRKVLKTALTDPNAVVIINTESVRLFSRLKAYGSIKLKRCRTCDKKFGDEGLTTARCEVHHKELNDFKFKAITLDEAHCVKNPAAQQTRAIWHLMHQPDVKYCWALTGTPISNHPGDLWSVMHAVAPEDFPSKSQFVTRYCLTAWNAFGSLEIVGIRPDTRDEFFKLLDPRFRRMLKAVVLPQLPPKVRSVRYVDMTSAQSKMYKELAKTHTTRTPTGELFIAPSHLEAHLRMMQIASTSIRIEKPDPDDVRTWVHHMVEPSPKLDAFEEVLDERGIFTNGYEGPPVLVSAEHKQLIGLAAKRLEKRGVKYALITGDVSPFEREVALDRLKRREIRVLFFTNKAGGVGLDMSASDMLVNLQRSWSLVAEVQKENRNHRIGSEIHESITIVDIIMKDTVEEEQVTKLHDKFERLDEITRDRAELLKLNPHASTTELDTQEELILSTPIAFVPQSEDDE